MPIKYVKGDATAPVGDGAKCIVHIVNDEGKWGKGFVMAVSRRWPRIREEYINWHSNQDNFKLGEVLFTRAESNIWVANMIAQHGTRNSGGKPPIRYNALEKCLKQVAYECRIQPWSVHMPKIGAGLAGGDWHTVEYIVENTFGDIPVTVYEL
jgi:O-acetyl-ADP-ribose deacetylase (regulator of RNase III)